MPGCVAVNCTKRAEQGFRLFRFPANTIRCKTWLNNMRRKDWTPTKSSYLCETHFEESQFENRREDGWKKLKPNAVPTLFNVQNSPPRKSLYKGMKNENIAPARKQAKISADRSDHAYSKTRAETQNKTLEVPEIVPNNKGIIENTFFTSKNEDLYVLHLELENKFLRQELTLLREKQATYRCVDCSKK